MSHGRQVRTFLFGDIEGSTRRWEADPGGMGEVVARHDEIVTKAVHEHGGVVFKHTGDGFCAVFEDPARAISAAVDAQKGLAGLNLPVRMGIQTGPAEERGGDWFGGVLSAVARLMGAGSGGQILVGESTEILVRVQLPDQTSLLHLGAHRFRDLGEPQVVFQVVHPDLQTEFPTIVSLDTVPHNLPVMVTSFVGRDQEVETVRGLLENHRIVTLTGVGGVGKTRLSLAVAATEAHRFPGGTWFVELASLSDGGLIPSELLAVMGLTGDHRDPEDVVLARLVEKPALLVFDNCEHVIDASAKIVETLVRGSPGTVVLVTSREALGVLGEAVYSVPSMRGADGISEAVELFVSRAQLVDPTFQVTTANREAVEQICERLDGIPLAIELATARLRVMAPEGIADRLDDRFRLLTGGSRTALPRQRTLAAAMDWSYDLLGEVEQTLLRRLSVFSGGFDLTAVEGVCSDGAMDVLDILDILDRLVSASLVIHEYGDRHRMLETVRQYAVDKLADTGETGLWRDRHLAYFEEMAGQINEALLGPNADDALRRFRADHDNLRLSMTWALESDGPTRAAGIAVGVYRLWQTLRLWSEAYTWYLRLYERVSDVQLKAQIAVYVAVCASNLFRTDEANEYYEYGFSLVDAPGGTPLERAVWRIQKANYLSSQRNRRAAYLEALEAVDYARIHVPDYAPAWWMAAFNGAFLDPDYTPHYDELLAEIAERVTHADQDQVVAESTPWLMIGLQRRGRLDEIPGWLKRYEDAVIALHGPDALPRARAISGVEYILGSVALERGDYTELKACYERSLRFGERDLLAAGVLGTAAVALGLHNHDNEAARKDFARFLASSSGLGEDWWELIWAAALLAEADGEPITSALLIGANDVDRRSTGMILASELHSLDTALRDRLQSALDDYSDLLETGASLTVDEIAALMHRVASGDYEESE